jgi:hypothetical protein
MMCSALKLALRRVYDHSDLDKISFENRTTLLAPL